MMASVPVAASSYLPAPLNAVPEIPEHPGFVRTTAPNGSGAKRAWKGNVGPFLDDSAARRFLRAVESGRPFDIAGGKIDARASTSSAHWADPWLTNTGLEFQLLVLEFEEPEHPRAYSLQPEISRQMHPLHPHLRMDKPVIVNQRPLPALCIYSGAQFEYSPNWSRIVQFLDQLTSYVARHIIWMKTRIEMPERFGEAFRTPAPGEPIFDHQSLIQVDPILSLSRRPAHLCTGYWPGPEATSGAVNHLKTISPSQECWCCSGKKYGNCHRPVELQGVRLTHGGRPRSSDSSKE